MQKNTHLLRNIPAPSLKSAFIPKCASTPKRILAFCTALICTCIFLQPTPAGAATCQAKGTNTCLNIGNNHVNITGLKSDFQRPQSAYSQNGKTDQKPNRPSRTPVKTTYEKKGKGKGHTPISTAPKRRVVIPHLDYAHAHKIPWMRKLRDSIAPENTKIHMEPDGWTVRNIPTNFYISRLPQVTISTKFNSSIIFTPRYVLWDFNNGTPLIRGGFGTSLKAIKQKIPFKTDTSAVYTQAGAHQVRARVFYTATVHDHASGSRIRLKGFLYSFAKSRDFFVHTKRDRLKIFGKRHDS